MCQYTDRCPVRRHKPATICPYTGRNAYSGGYRSEPASTRFLQASPSLSAPRSTSPAAPAARPSPAAPSSSGRRARRWGAQETGAAGISGLDLLILLVLASQWEHVRHSTTWFIVSVVLAALPLFIGLGMTARCTAWNRSQEGRCRKRRPGFLRRCEEDGHGHLSQPITTPEVVSLVCVAVTIAVGYVKLVWPHGDGSIWPHAVDRSPVALGPNRPSLSGGVGVGRDRYGDVVADECGRGEGVEDFVEAEPVW